MNPPFVKRSGMGLLPRAAFFLLAFAVLQLGWQASRGTFVQRFVVHECTVRPAVYVINVLTPAVHATARGSSVAAVGGGLNIENGCEGLEALLLLVAAFLVAPIPWRSRLSGLIFGSALVFLLNQARILALFYAYRASHALFDPLHADVLPIILVLIVCAYFYAWLAYSNRRLAQVG